MNSSLRILVNAVATAAVLPLSACSLWPFGRDAADEQQEAPLAAENWPDELADSDVERRPVSVYKVDTEHFQLGAYTGGVSTDQEKELGLYGLRAAYLINEDFFVEANYEFSSSLGFDLARSLVGADDAEDVDYTQYGLSAAYNFLPGEVYVGTRYTVPFAAYVLAGVGNADYEDEQNLTYTGALGVTFLPQDWWTIRLEVGNRFWEDDDGGDGYNHNPYGTLGLGIFF